MTEDAYGWLVLAFSAGLILSMCAWTRRKPKVFYLKRSRAAWKKIVPHNEMG